MKGGYLATLAARTLGAAPLLKPATPSRFEPDRLHSAAALYEVEETRLAFGAPVPPPPEATPQRTAPAGRRPAPGPEHRLDPEAPLLPTAWERTVAAELSGWALSPPGPPPPEQTPHPQAGPEATRAARERAQTPPRDGRPDAPTEIEAMARQAAPAPGPARHVEPAPGKPPRAFGNSATARDGKAEADEAPIVVRIGRIDVRAVQGPAPPPTPAPPRQPAGLSLDEYLLARDRGAR
jgi:hypothetical protein